MLCLPVTRSVTERGSIRHPSVRQRGRIGPPETEQGWRGGGLWVGSSAAGSDSVEKLLPGAREVLGNGWELSIDRVRHPVELRVNGCGIGLFVDRVQRLLDRPSFQLM